jgi:hypothetical protein
MMSLTKWSRTKEKHLKLSRLVLLSLFAFILVVFLLLPLHVHTPFLCVTVIPWERCWLPSKFIRVVYTFMSCCGSRRRRCGKCYRWSDNITMKAQSIWENLGRDSRSNVRKEHRLNWELHDKSMRTVVSVRG